MDQIMVSHNLPGTDGNLAPSMLDVDPSEGAVAVISLAIEAISNLPNR
jgi:hypothetical protein